MAVQFNIPRLTDIEIVEAFRRIAQELSDSHRFRVMIDVPIHGGTDVTVAQSDLDSNSPLGFILAAGSHLASQIQLRGSNDHQALFVNRKLNEPFDLAVLPDEWNRNLPGVNEQGRAVLHMKLLSLGRRYLKAGEIDASLTSDPTNAWSKFRNAQTQVLASLESTAQKVITDVAQQNAKIDEERTRRFGKLEEELRQALAKERETLDQQYAAKVAELEKREEAQNQKESAFQTKEARYVSRQKQEDQITQIKGWLESWNLTKGTSRKRWPIVAAYVCALLFTGALTLFITMQNYAIINSADDLAKLQWWHWVLIASKSFFPLAAFTTFMVYFIRWSSSWARQHSEEEFRNRTRLIDIGRSGWLLEAVRDAADQDGTIPPELLRELSKNLFANTPSSDADIHPSAMSDLLVQGLSSIRVKSSDGSEFEASRNKGKKE